MAIPSTCQHRLTICAAVLKGNSSVYGQPANVAEFVSADTNVRNTKPLAQIETVRGPAPGKTQSDGRLVFILGQHFGNVFVGLQPTFGYEGDPMRLLFERGFAPTLAFVQFYHWLRTTFNADALLHFGMHGALEFMPGKQAGLGAGDWPDHLIGEMPNIYLYAANNPSEASLAKRRSNAITITHLTPPLAQAGLYNGLIELKETLTRWRISAADSHDLTDLEALIVEQAAARCPPPPAPITWTCCRRWMQPGARGLIPCCPRYRNSGQPSRAVWPLYRPGARPRSDPFAADSADRAQYPRLRSVPHAH